MESLDDSLDASGSFNSASASMTACDRSFSPTQERTCLPSLSAFCFCRYLLIVSWLDQAPDPHGLARSKIFIIITRWPRMRAIHITSTRAQSSPELSWIQPDRARPSRDDTHCAVSTPHPGFNRLTAVVNGSIMKSDSRRPNAEPHNNLWRYVCSS